MLDLTLTTLLLQLGALESLQVVSLHIILLIDGYTVLYHCVLPGDPVRVLLDHARSLIELRHVGLGGHVTKLHLLLRLLFGVLGFNADVMAQVGPWGLHWD